MKNIGFVKKYNGYYGKILDLSGNEYILIKEEIMKDNQINKLDTVSFVPEEYHKDETYEKVARFVKKIPNVKK